MANIRKILILYICIDVITAMGTFYYQVQEVDFKLGQLMYFIWRLDLRKFMEKWKKWSKNKRKTQDIN